MSIVKPCSWDEFAFYAGCAERTSVYNTIGNSNFIVPSYSPEGTKKNGFPELFANYVNSQTVRRHIKGIKPEFGLAISWQWKEGDEKTLKLVGSDSAIYVHSLDTYWLNYYPIIQRLNNTRTTEEYRLLLASFREIQIENGIFVGGDSNPSHFLVIFFLCGLQLHQMSLYMRG